MPKAIQSHILLLLLFAFAFLYRLLLLLWAGFPPGADIGLHNSVIHSIIGSGNVDFLYNFYHIGGGVSLTFPGYHIFTAAVMLMTGLPEYIVHALVVSLFSASIVLCAYLITKKVWTTAAAFIVAFLVALSRFDIEMLLWAGYPNMIALMLIALAFYMYLQEDRFSRVPFLVSVSLLVASLFLTHSLSAVMFVLIAGVTAVIVLAKPKILETTRKTVLYWIAPIALGVVLASPFLVQAIPTYLVEYGSSDITAATLSTRILPLEIVLPLFGVIAAFFVFSKKYYKNFFVLPSFLLAMWVFVPLILTQGYVVGLPVDYNRFLYFLILPVMIFIAVFIDHGAEFFANITHTYKALTLKTQKTGQTLENKFTRFGQTLTKKNLYSIFALAFLLFSFTALPIFMNPSMNVGESIQSFYQTMTQPGWEAIQWAKQNTAGNAVFVSDALYGWWFGGFAQRPTLSAVDPEYLTVNREVDNATFARNVLDTDYIIDNGLIQVRDDGGYVARHNPEILVLQNWTYYPYSFFTYDSRDVGITYSVDGANSYVALDNLAVKDMALYGEDDYRTIMVRQGNEYFNYTRYTSVYRGLLTVNLTNTLTTTLPDVSFISAEIGVQTTGTQIPYNNQRSIGLVELSTKAFGQLIFNTEPTEVTVNKESSTSDIVKSVKLRYVFNDNEQAKMEMSALAFSASNNPQIYSDQAERVKFFTPIMLQNLNSNPTPQDLPFTTFDYQQQLLSRNISYIACRNTDIDPKFQKDPLFNLVFINKEVAIFQVNGNLRGAR
jgi:hypothetical protein